MAAAEDSGREKADEIDWDGERFCGKRGFVERGRGRPRYSRRGRRRYRVIAARWGGCGGWGWERAL
jgi:hypothetical protein